MSGAQSLDRRAAVKALMAACPDVLAIAGLGSSAYDLFAAGDRDLNYYLWGAMGGAASIGLGWRWRNQKRPFWCSPATANS